MSFSIITPRPTAEDVAKAITLFDSPSRTRLQTRNSLHIVASTLQHMLGAIGREGREVEARVIRARVSLDTLMQLVHGSEIKVTDIAGEMELEWIEQGSLYGQGRCSLSAATVPSNILHNSSADSKAQKGDGSC